MAEGNKTRDGRTGQSRGYGAVFLRAAAVAWLAGGFAAGQEAGVAQQCEGLVGRAMRQARALPAGDAGWAAAHRDLGRVLWACGRLEEAEAAYRRSLELWHGGGVTDDSSPAEAAMELAVLCLDGGRPEAAARVLERIGPAVEAGGPRTGLRADWEYLSGVAAWARGAMAEAERRLLAAGRGWQLEGGRRVDRVVHLHAALARIREAAGKRVRAREHVAEGLALAEGLKPESSEADARAVIHLASVHELLADARLEEPLVRRAMEAGARYPSVPPGVRAILAECYAGVLKRLGRKGEAQRARAEARRLRSAAVESARRRHAVDYQDLLRAAKK